MWKGGSSLSVCERLFSIRLLALQFQEETLTLQTVAVLMRLLAVEFWVDQ